VNEIIHPSTLNLTKYKKKKKKEEEIKIKTV
jgi:hypothetical protein